MKLSARHQIRIYDAINKIQEDQNYCCEVPSDEKSQYFRVTYMPEPTFRFVASESFGALEVARTTAAAVHGVHIEGDPVCISVKMKPGITGTFEKRAVEDFDTCLEYLHEWTSAAVEEYDAALRLEARAGNSERIDFDTSFELVDDILSQSDIDDVSSEVESRIDELDDRLQRKLEEISKRLQEVESDLSVIDQQKSDVSTVLKEEKERLSVAQGRITRVKHVLGHAKETGSQLAPGRWLANIGVWLSGSLKGVRSDKAVSFVRLFLLFLLGQPEHLLTTPDILNVLGSDGGGSGSGETRDDENTDDESTDSTTSKL